MSIPFTHTQKVWDAQAVSATAELELIFRFCPTKIIEITLAAFSGTLDFQGKADPAGTYDNLKYQEIGLAAEPNPGIAQLSFTTITARHRYLLIDHYPLTQIVMTRTAGTITCVVWGFDAPVTQPWELTLGAGTAEIGKLAAGSALIGKVGIDQTTLGTTNAVQEKPPTGITNLAANTTTAGTEIPVIVASTPCRFVHIVAKPANTGLVYIGGSDVSSTLYTEVLNAGESIDIPIDNANKVYFDVSVTGEGIQAGYLAV